ncbi:MAG: hypothetical protein H0T62_09825 [Parachlamydiaceae bacterium]|nr:hypothetical protein [Parachlamydiaceae bacterium]
MNFAVKSPGAQLIAKTYPQYGNFPDLKEQYIKEVEKSNIKDADPGFTEIRNESPFKITCGNELIYPGMTALFAYTYESKFSPLKLDKLNFPLLERNVRKWKLDMYGEKSDCKEDVAWFKSIKFQSLEDTGYDTTFSIRVAEESDFDEILTTFESYMTNKHEYDLNSRFCSEILKYSEDPEEYRERFTRPTVLMVTVNQTAIQTFKEAKII